MDSKQALLKRLEDYSLDDPNSLFPFSSKLSKETGWTPTFTQRAIKEYKRFCFLAMTAGHPVSPSEAVDEVWHMHLIYSHEYWKVFCPQVLQKEFHHYPSTGGWAEKNKFEDWLAKTLASYREAFGEEPPADIWLSHSNFRTSPTIESVDLSSHWVIPKRTLSLWGRIGLLTCFLVAIAGCAESAIGNPLNYRGPEFLQFYIFLLITTTLLGAITRWFLRLPAKGRLDEASYPGPYSIAYLNGKRVLAVNTAITSLLHRKVIEFDIKKLSLALIDPHYQPQDTLEATIIRSASRTGGIEISMLRRNCESAISAIHQELADKGLVMSKGQGLLASLTGFIVGMTAPLYGLIKIEIGISRDRPVLYLEILVAVSVILCLFFLIRPFRSRYGDQFLASLRTRKTGLMRMNRQLDHIDSNDIALGMAIFGAGALYGSSLDPQIQRLNPPVGSNSCGGGSYSSSSSSSSCGSSCGGGGGGGCGGGCGGCGG